jgi:putative DNA primase/helicase
MIHLTSSREDRRERWSTVRQRAHGRWTEILAALGVDDAILRRRNLPCPVCRSGTDRFQYTDRFGEGNYFCRSCGAGGGMKLLQAVRGLDFGQALHQVERCLGMLPAQRPPHGAPAYDGARLAQRLWAEARPIAAGDAVHRYLSNRGLQMADFPSDLRCHPAMGYYAKDSTGQSVRVAEHPAMLACVRDREGCIVTLHRTYLADGGKLRASDAKKLLSGGIDGAAVHLAEATEMLGVCEGVETALAVRLATNRPVWAALSAGNMEKLRLPSGVHHLRIYADNDGDSEFTGQLAAYALARRLRREPHGSALDIQVLVPPRPGADWADVWTDLWSLAPSDMAETWH